MTRFARAKGSKSSNERIPESSTPWQEMKEELHKKQKEKSQEKEREKVNAERQSKYNNFLQELESKTETVWAEVTDEPTKNNNKVQKKMEKKSKKDNQLKKSGNDEVLNPKSKTIKKQKKNKLKIFESVTNGEINVNENTEIKTVKAPKQKLEQTAEEIKTKPKKKNKKLNKPEIQNGDDDAPEEISSKKELIDVVIKKQKKKRNKPLIIPSVINKTENEEIKTEKAPKRKLEQTEDNKPTKKKKNNGEINNSINSIKNQEENNDNKPKKNKKKPKTKDLNANSDQQVNTDNKNNKNSNKTGENGVVTENSDQKVKKKNRRTKKNNKNNADNQNDSINNANNNQNKQNKNNYPPKKIGKIRDDKEHPRRKPDNGAMTMFLNGKRVEIIKFEGFPVRKEDADRLLKLKQTMIKKGVPQSEIRKAMQLERRKAEKSLARERKTVCFHCRKSGHVLAECPEMMQEHVETIGTGICFKCGSTEHTHFECRVTRTDTYKFATCFICKEQGHIAKQCPDNPKGMYPKGGACKLCGDVTHLKKDCPTLQESKDNGPVVNTITDDNLEGLGNEAKKTIEVKMKNKSKIVKF